jgi:hypothetical protein
VGVRNRQSRWTGGVTVNLFQKDLQTEKLYIEVFGPNESRAHLAGDARIGHLIDGYDRWWTKDEPNGPQELAQAVIEHGLPWFDRVRTLEEQAISWYGRDLILNNDRGYGQHVILLALTLYRMGQYDDACRIVRHPTPRHPLPGTVERTARLREWLDEHPLA